MSLFILIVVVSKGLRGEPAIQERPRFLARHPGSADCARRRTRRDAPTWSLAPVSSLSLSLARSARGIKEKDIHQGGRSSRPNGDDPRPVVVHPRADSTVHSPRMTSSSRDNPRVFEDIRGLCCAWSSNLFERPEYARSTLVKFEVKRSSIDLLWILDPRQGKYEDQWLLSFSSERLWDGYVVG